MRKTVIDRILEEDLGALREESLVRREVFKKEYQEKIACLNKQVARNLLANPKNFREIVRKHLEQADAAQAELIRKVEEEEEFFNQQRAELYLHYGLPLI